MQLNKKNNKKKQTNIICVQLIIIRQEYLINRITYVK